jgi:hypothetical protein
LLRARTTNGFFSASAASSKPATGCLRPVTFHTSRFSTKGIILLPSQQSGGIGHFSRKCPSG